MITTKNNFKGFLRRKYPTINAYPVYGLPMYILDHPLNQIDTWEYNVQPLPNGKYVAFIGVTVQEATKLLEQLNKDGVPSNSHSREKETAPTTFSCFEAWLDRHQIKAFNRTFCNNMSPEECFHSEHIESCPAPQKKGTWYMYELPGYINTGKTLANIPNITVDYGPKGDITICLIKASASKYKSKRQRLMEKFQFMQPIYEQLIAACAIASQNDSAADWDKALGLCIQYMQVQFEKEGIVNVDKMKEAYKNGTIGLFTRDPNNMYIDNDETF